MDEINLEDLNPNYSIGTGIMVNQLIAQLSSGAYDKDTIVININTILRNRYDSKSFTSVLQWVNDTHLEIQNLISELVDVMISANISNPSIITYSADYSGMIPKMFWRPTTTTRSRYATATQMLAKRNMVVSTNRQVQYNFHYLHGRAPIATQLIHAIQRMQNRRKIYLISHSPIDFHICEKLKGVDILESYTGKTIDISELGQKVFKLDNVPFNQFTHVLMGDKEQYVSPMNRSDKKKFLALSVADRWNLKTKYQIEGSLKRHNFIIPFRLI